MYADDTLLQMHFDDLDQLQEALKMCDLLLDQLTSLNPEKSALLLQLHGGSAQQVRSRLVLTKEGEKFVQLPSGRLIALKKQVPYLGIITSYHDYEMQSLRHRIQASKAVMKEVAHAVRNSHAVTEKRRMSIWRITAWTAALYGLHVVGLTEQGLSTIESHMLYQLRFVLQSYSQSTRESNQDLLRRKGLKTPQAQIMARLRKFIKRQTKGDKEALFPHYLPRPRRVEETLPQLQRVDRGKSENRDQLQVCTECGAIFIGTGALRRHSQKHHSGITLFPHRPKFDPMRHCKAGVPECLACFRTYFYLRRHIESSTCPRVHLLLRAEQQFSDQQTELSKAHAEVMRESLLDPASAASNPDLHVWLMESCAL